MMLYSRYFKSGQKVLLRSLAAEPGRFEALTAFFKGGGADHFDLLLPYRAQGEESYPFAPGMPFEVLSEALGMGVRVTGSYAGPVGDDGVRLHLDSDLQIYKRRLAVRIDTDAGLRYTKGKGTLRSFHEQWAKNVEILRENKTRLPEFPRCQVNLSVGGVRFAINPPVEVADISLLLLELESGKPPICALAEVVWLEEKEVQGRRRVGMQFLNILQEDQERIAKFIRAREPSNDSKGV